MERQMTADVAGIDFRPRFNTRLLSRIALTAAVAGVAIGLVFAMGSRSATSATSPDVNADLLRWQAVAAAHEGHTVPAVAAESARWSGLAGAHTSLTPGQQAAAARWEALSHAALDAGQSAYAARLKAAAGGE